MNESDQAPADVMSCQAEKQGAFFWSEHDGALLLPPEERRKRYTGKQAAELERLHTAVLMLLPSWPVEDIARNLRLSTRTVRAVAAQSGEKVAGFNKEFAEVLIRTGARWVALAMTKEGDASFRDLNIGAGIVMDHARDLLLMGAMGEEKIVKEETDHARAAQALRDLALRAVAPPDTVSVGHPLNDNHLEKNGASTTSDATTASGPTNSTNPEPAEGGRGGSDPAESAEGSMDLPDGGFQPKGFLPPPPGPALQR